MRFGPFTMDFYDEVNTHRNSNFGSKNSKFKAITLLQWCPEGGGVAGGGHGPRAQALEGAPGHLVGGEF